MVEPLTKAVSATAERQMRQWTIGLEVQERVEHEHAISQLARQIHPYIAISRDAGTGAEELARRIGARLGWDVLDKELLEVMAEKFHLEKAMLQVVDETTTSWMLEVFGKWISQQVVTNSEYVTRLGKVLIMAARHASIVFVGRGAQFVLPRERCLAVQIIAPLQMRLERVMQQDGLNLDEAKRHLKKKDAERRAWLKEHFGHDVTDPHLYDLVINLERTTLDTAADLIVRACQQRFSSGPIATPH